MNPAQFNKTLYLGDRLLLAIEINGTKHQVAFKVDCISRVRGESWNYYTEEDVYEGFIVFEGVENCRFGLAEGLPNDWIEVVSIAPENNAGTLWQAVLSLGTVDAGGASSETLVTIVFCKMYIRTSNNLKIED